MDVKATRIDLGDVATAPMRVFHLAWMALFACCFAWFAVAPPMPLIGADLGLSKDRIADLNIAAVGATILARLVIGPLCDRFGPRRTYAWLLALGALPVMGIGLAQGYEGFLFLRLCIGLIGASFVVTQMHTSALFAPNVVGTANAIAAGWGNAGAGATQAVMPLIVAAVVALGGVAGIVGAGGNAGAVAAGLLAKSAMTTAPGLLVLGCCVVVSGVATLAVRFSTEHEASELIGMACGIPTLM